MRKTVTCHVNKLETETSTAQVDSTVRVTCSVRIVSHTARHHAAALPRYVCTFVCMCEERAAGVFHSAAECNAAQRTRASHVHHVLTQVLFAQGARHVLRLHAGPASCGAQSQRFFLCSCPQLSFWVAAPGYLKSPRRSSGSI